MSGCAYWMKWSFKRNEVGKGGFRFLERCCVDILIPFKITHEIYVGNFISNLTCQQCQPNYLLRFLFYSIVVFVWNYWWEFFIAILVGVFFFFFFYFFSDFQVVEYTGFIDLCLINCKKKRERLGLHMITCY
jgi:hypothetical protein